jgi:hypothetical protein
MTVLLWSRATDQCPALARPRPYLAAFDAREGLGALSGAPR